MQLWVRVFEVLIAQELRLKVQVATSTSLYTARRARASKGKGAKGDIVLSLQYHRFVGRCIVQDKSCHMDKVIREAPLDSARDDRR